MSDNIRVLDCRVDELAANLNAIAEHFAPVVWNFYDRTTVKPCPFRGGADPSCQGASSVELERRVTVVMGKVTPQVAMVPMGPDIMKLR